MLGVVTRAGLAPTWGCSIVGDGAEGGADGLTTVTSQWNNDDGGARPILEANSVAKKTAVPCRQSEMIHPLARRRTKASGVPGWESVTGAQPPG